MKKQLEQLKKEFIELVDKVVDRAALEELKVQFLGRKGKLNAIMKEMASLADEERKLVGAVANEVKQAIEAAFGEAEGKSSSTSMESRSAKEWIDMTQPAIPPREQGHLHPVTQVQEGLEELFTSMGFMVLDGPELESDYYNFTALNIPPSHPARDMKDKFYVEGLGGLEGGERLGGVVMRTHTSSFQVRAMKQYVDERFTKVDETLEDHTDRLGRIEQRLDSQTVRLDNHDQRISALEKAA